MGFLERLFGPRETEEQVTAREILEMIEEMGRVGRELLRTELEIDRAELARIRRGLEVVATGSEEEFGETKLEGKDLENLDELFYIVKDIYDDMMEGEDEDEDE